MTDPLRALHTPTRPVDPDPEFARALRTRMERALLDLPPVPAQEDTMTTPLDAPTTTATLIPYLAVVDARAAVEFYVTVFGARRRGEPIVMPDGRVGHVEVAIGDSVLMLADEYPEMGLVAPVNRGGPSQSLRLEVGDPDVVVARAVDAGATLERPVTDSPYGRGGTVVDPSGHRWMVAREAPVVHPGDVVYASLWTPDVERAARFYADVLGWTLAGDHLGTGRHVEDRSPHLGIHPRDDRPTTMLCYAVRDVDATVDLVRAAGGTAEDPTDEPFGRAALCADDQGIPFSVATLGGEPATAGAGDLDYVEIQVPDAGRARAFYGTVLGWRFAPGTQEGYWHPTAADGGFTRPMSGLVGGHAESTVVPTFRVADLAAAAAAVRAAGGTATELDTGRHGTLVECVDDQGAPFVLGRL